MSADELRRSFLDFFAERDHTVVPSASLIPHDPSLMFTVAGMVPFKSYFVGDETPPYQRAVSSQKCARAGGKHNDLDDVGRTKRHLVFFEMLGNFSFGDYFKSEIIPWSWELVTEVWGFDGDRLWITVHEGDDEAEAIWHEGVGVPLERIQRLGDKDNFWQMGDTGPCGPCSEIHIDLTPQGDTRGALVNKGTAECIEIWNLVFIQFNANPDGTFTPLPARHVDTGMGFERVCAIVQGTKGFTEFSNARVSNYETDIFRPLFDEIEKLSGKKYGSTLPEAGSTGHSEQEKIDIAFRVIADHARTLSFAVADGINPGNNDRNYVLRRILRRAVRYGRTLGFHEPFFYKLTGVLSRTMGDVFPELRAKQAHVEQVIKGEEEAFNRTLDKGIALFEAEADKAGAGGKISGAFAFRLYDEQGFPLDLTELMARERGLAVDTAGFEK
jgi:alanyl-tRNA synthetase